MTHHNCLEVIRLDNARWPQAALYRVMYYSYALDGEWVMEPAVIYFNSAPEYDLWMYDQFTDSLQQETCFKARVYRMTDGSPDFLHQVTYP